MSQLSLVSECMGALFSSIIADCSSSKLLYVAAVIMITAL